MFGFFKKCFFTAITFFSCFALKCVSMNVLECKIGSEIININSNEPRCYPYSIEVNKCSGSCNKINGPCLELCVPGDAKNINVKVLNLISRTNATRHIKWHEICECKCRLDTSACSNKQSWNNDKCRCECKELFNNGRCDKGFIWNPVNCECECDKLCDIGKYLDYKNCKCRKKLVDRLAEECSENINENKMIYNGTLNDYGKICNSFTVCIILLVIFFIMSIGISSVFNYFYWY